MHGTGEKNPSQYAVDLNLQTQLFIYVKCELRQGSENGNLSMATSDKEEMSTSVSHSERGNFSFVFTDCYYNGRSVILATTTATILNTLTRSL